MASLLCKGCDQKFIPSHGAQKYCTRACALTNKNAARRAQRRAYRAARKFTHTQTQSCETCKIKFCHLTTFPKRRARFCSKICRDKNHYNSNEQSRLHTKFLYRYGITLKEYNALLTIQRKACAMCGHKPKKGERRLAVDHCHETSDVRGLLCAKCNTALGLLNDDVKLLEEGIKYLTKPPLLPKPRTDTK